MNIRRDDTHHSTSPSTKTKPIRVHPRNPRPIFRRAVLSVILILVAALLAACTGKDAPPPEIAADFSLPDSEGNMVSLADELAQNEQVVLVFYFGYRCPPCMNQLKGISSDLANYEEKGAQVLAIAIQRLRGAQISADETNAQFPILADIDHAVAEAYGVEDDGWSTPSVFVINQDGHIVWKHITFIEGAGCGDVRVPSQTILEHLL